MKKLCISIEVLPDHFDLKDKESVARYLGCESESNKYYHQCFIYKEKLYLFKHNYDEDNKYIINSTDLLYGMEINMEETNNYEKLEKTYINSIEQLKTDLKTTKEELSFFKKEYSKPKIDKDLVLELISAVNGNKLK